MNRQAVQILCCDFCVDERVEFVDHERESVELVTWIVEVHAYVFVEEDLTSLFVGVDVADSQKKAEVLADVLQELGLSIQSKRSTSLDEHLQLIAAVRVVIVALHQPGVDLAVRKIADGLE